MTDMLTPHFRDESVTVYHGDCLDVLAALPDVCVDSVVTDPPYGLNFMGKHWDDGAVAFDPVVWGHCLRVLKPGGHLLAFGGTRTWHRLACAVEDAGFEMRDSIAWLFGSGFPKSMDVSKAIDKAAGAEREVTRHERVGIASGSGNAVGGPKMVVPLCDNPATDDAKRWAGWGTALKPAFEPVVCARKPLSGTVAGNVLAYGVGALNIDGCRVDSNNLPKANVFTRRTQMSGDRRSGAAAGMYADGDNHNYEPHTAGRWPSNVVVDEFAAQEIDRQSGDVRGAPGMRQIEGSVTFTVGQDINEKRFVQGIPDSGGASRFFPTFKYQAKAPQDERPNVNGISHATVKPLDLMRWLVLLVTPPGGLVLEPFAGSGTTAEACIHEHMKCIAIEREADYLPLIVSRLTKPIEVGFDFNIK